MGKKHKHEKHHKHKSDRDRDRHSTDSMEYDEAPVLIPKLIVKFGGENTPERTDSPQPAAPRLEHNEEGYQESYSHHHRHKEKKKKKKKKHHEKDKEHRKKKKRKREYSDDEQLELY